MNSTEQSVTSDCLSERIVVLDGAMGTMIQAHRLDEKAFRGERFAQHGKDLKGCNDLLCMTQSDLIADIHAAVPRSRRRYRRDQHF